MGAIIGGAVAGIFIAVIIVLAKKTNARQAEYLKMLSQEQLDMLQGAGFTPVDGKTNLAMTKAILTETRDKGAKVFLGFIWYNASTQRHEIGEFDMAKEKAETKVLQPASTVLDIVLTLENGMISGLKDVL
ncbi:MAG: hypothetical protein MJ105_06120 [Lachnospiraceae bacterium]|nr:hypothetical protein [Lachnospiraceae bacterium]